MEKEKLNKDKDTLAGTFETYPDVLSVEQVSEMLGISTKTAYKLLSKNKIKHFKIGRTYKIPKINLLSFIGLV